MEGQLTLDGEQLRDQGVEQVLASDPNREWADRAYAVLVGLAEADRQIHADDVREQVGPPPGHHNAMGAVFRRAAAAGVIVPAGMRRSRRAERHAQMGMVWIGARWAERRAS